KTFDQQFDVVPGERHDLSGEIQRLFSLLVVEEFFAQRQLVRPVLIDSTAREVRCSRWQDFEMLPLETVILPVDGSIGANSFDAELVAGPFSEDNADVAKFDVRGPSLGVVRRHLAASFGKANDADGVE